MAVGVETAASDDILYAQESATSMAVHNTSISAYRYWFNKTLPT